MKPSFNGLEDYTGVTALEVSTNYVWDTAAVYRRFDADDRLRGAKYAMVATNDALYGLSLMYETLRSESQVEFRVFRDLAQAREWLGLPSEIDDSGSTWKTIS